jgi:hypothetical protein
MQYSLYSLSQYLRARRTSQLSIASSASVRMNLSGRQAEGKFQSKTPRANKLPKESERSKDRPVLLSKDVVVCLGRLFRPWMQVSTVELYVVPHKTLVPLVCIQPNQRTALFCPASRIKGTLPDRFGHLGNRSSSHYTWTSRYLQTSRCATYRCQVGSFWRTSAGFQELNFCLPFQIRWQAWGLKKCLQGRVLGCLYLIADCNFVQLAWHK